MCTMLTIVISLIYIQSLSVESGGVMSTGGRYNTNIGRKRVVGIRHHFTITSTTTSPIKVKSCPRNVNTAWNISMDHFIKPSLTHTHTVYSEHLSKAIMVHCCSCTHALAHYSCALYPVFVYYKQAECS